MRPAQPPARTWLYVRVSGREQATDGTSLDGQTDRGRAYFRGLGYPEPEVRVEVEGAGEDKIERRVELHRLIRDARPGDLVAVALLDRWSRDIVFGVQSVRKLTRAGIGFHAIHEQIDASTPNGDEMLGLRMWVAETERRRIRDRTVGRADELRRQGLWAYGATPWGYQRGDRKERRHLLLEPDDHAAHVREAFERLRDGGSLRDVAVWTAAHGGPRHLAALHRLVRGRIYLGEVWVGTGPYRLATRRTPQAAGEWIRGQHPPLIDEELWQATQDALAGRRLKPPRSLGAEWSDGLLLPGALSCGICGRRACVGRVVNRWGTVFRYYVCFARRRPERDAARRKAGGGPARCPGPYVRAETLDEVAELAVVERLEELRELLAGRPERDGGDGGKPPEDFNAERRRIESRLARAVSAFTDGAFTREELAAQRARLDAEIAKVRAREDAAARERRAADPKARGNLRRAIADLRKTWRKATVDERRRIVRLLVAKVEILDDKSLRWTWRSVEDLLAE